MIASRPNESQSEVAALIETYRQGFLSSNHRASAIVVSFAPAAGKDLAGACRIIASALMSGPRLKA
jgi:hypothetical protein